MKRVVTFLLAAGFALAVAAPAASAAPAGSDPATAARYAASWIVRQVNTSGFIAQAGNPAKANLSVTAQAVIALASAGVGKAQVAALLGYLGSHVDDFVAATGTDDPGALAYLVLAAKAGGADPASFGPAHANLVTRLVATQQPSGLFGSSDPSFDGAFREGLALQALHAAGVANPAGVAWLETQQCADGSFTAFRADTAVACPAVDPNTFSGPDTNSTALAVLGLAAQGDSAAASKGAAALDAVRNGGGGWGFLSRADQPSDANSTGVVLIALRTVNGTPDAPRHRRPARASGGLHRRGRRPRWDRVPAGSRRRPDARCIRHSGGHTRVGRIGVADHDRDDLGRRTDSVCVGARDDDNGRARDDDNGRVRGDNGRRDGVDRRGDRGRRAAADGLVVGTRRDLRGRPGRSRIALRRRCAPAPDVGRLPPRTFALRRQRRRPPRRRRARDAVERTLDGSHTPSHRRIMNEDRARALLRAERTRIEGLLVEATAAGRDDRAAANEEGDITDPAQPLNAMETDDAVAAALQERLAALDRAEQRLEQGTYGLSIRSGTPIPDARLEADPAAELTVEEAQGS